VTKISSSPLNTSPTLSLILGGARSGKSGYAEQLAKDSGLPVTYVATAQAFDEEMSQRIKKHQLDRPDHWQSIEVPTQLPAIIKKHGNQGVVLVDCLTLWLMNLLHEELEVHQYVNDLLEALAQIKGNVILVSNEISMGVVPMGEMSRLYVDELGRMHQKIAKQATNVTLMVAGLPMTVKNT